MDKDTIEKYDPELVCLHESGHFVAQFLLAEVGWI